MQSPDDGLRVLDDQGGALVAALGDLGYGVLVLGPDDRVVAASDRAEVITGYPLSEMRALRDVTEVYAPEDRGAVRAGGV